MVISQGEVWWASQPPPTGSGPGFRRPVVVVQGDALNRSRIATVVCVPLTSNLQWDTIPQDSRLTRESPLAERGAQCGPVTADHVRYVEHDALAISRGRRRGASADR